MTLDELRERIKDEVVLHEGDVADYQWRQMGLTDEATKLGLSGPDFGRLVNQISLTVAPDLGRITDIKRNVVELARRRRKQLTDADIRQIMDEAERAHLTRSFVTDTWLPRLLVTVPDGPPADTDPARGPAQPTPTVEPVEAPNRPVNPPAGAVSTSGAAVETAESVQRKVRDVLDDYQGFIPAQAIRSLFRTLNYDEAGLAGFIQSYLTTHFYAPEGIPQGATLREQLTATDWRHLVSWDRPTEAAPVPAEPAVANPPVAAPARQRAGASNTAIIVGAFAFVALLLFVLLRSVNQSPEPARTRARTTPSKPVTGEPTTRKTKNRRRRSGQSAAVQATNAAGERAVQTPAKSTTDPRSKPAYDRLLSEVGQYGERAASRDGKWGLWRSGTWFILPDYDDVTVFRNGRATVVLNGQEFVIDRYANQIRE